MGHEPDFRLHSNNKDQNHNTHSLDRKQAAFSLNASWQLAERQIVWEVGGRSPICWGHRSPECRVNQYGQDEWVRAGAVARQLLSGEKGCISASPTACTKAAVECQP